MAFENSQILPDFFPSLSLQFSGSPSRNSFARNSRKSYDCPYYHREVHLPRLSQSCSVELPAWKREFLRGTFHGAKIETEHFPYLLDNVHMLLYFLCLFSRSTKADFCISTLQLVTYLKIWLPCIASSTRIFASCGDRCLCSGSKKEIDDPVRKTGKDLHQEDNTVGKTCLPSLDRMMLLMADYVRFEVSDINGTAKGRMICVKDLSKSDLEQLRVKIKYGTANHSAICYAEPTPKDGALGGKAPLVSQLPWLQKSRGMRAVSLLCGTRIYTSRGTALWDPANPREVSQRLLKRLSNMGYHFYSRFSPDFTVTLAGGSAPHSITDLMLYNTMQQMSLAGIQATSSRVHKDGRVSISLTEQTGLDAADTAFRLINDMRECFSLDGKAATFLSKPFPDSSPNTMVFTHRIRPAASGAEAFELSGTDGSMPDPVRHWIGGLQRHAPALMAFCAPTTNCYWRCMESGFKECTWGLGPRSAAISVWKSPMFKSKEAVFETDLSSSAANPYLVVAATLAAGIDGLTNRIEPMSSPGSRAGCPVLPIDLKEAVDALEKDETIMRALGKPLIESFMYVKQAEMTVAEGFSSSASVTEAIHHEREMYRNYI